jgi:hypothetical protein
MTHYQDDLLSAWLGEGPQHGSPAAVDEVLARAGAARQRPGWMVALTGGTIADTPGSSLLRYAVVALTLIALVGLLAGAMIAGGILAPNPLPPIVAEPTATPRVVAGIPELPAAGAVRPGRYFFAKPSRSTSDYERIVFTLPAGWQSRGALVAKHPDEANEVAFSIWTVNSIYADPCHWQSSALVPLTHALWDPEGAGFLRDESPWYQSPEARLATAPVKVQLGKVSHTTTILIELTVPVELDISTCDLGEYRAWTEWDGVDAANAHFAAGQVDEVYFVDVDRRTLVIDATYRIGSSPADVAELEQILASIDVVR